MKSYTCCYCFSVFKLEGPKPQKCPNCGEGYWSKTPAEETCFKLQNEYLINRGVSKKLADKALSDLYYFIIKYSIGMTKKLIKSKKIFEDDDLNDIGSQVALTFMNKYLSDLEFKMNSSFGKWITFLLLPILFGEKTKMNDRTLSLDFSISSNNNNSSTDLIDILSVNPHTNEETSLVTRELKLKIDESKDLRDSVLILIDNLKQNIIEKYDRTVAMNAVQGLNHLFSGKNIEFMGLFYSTHGGIYLQNIVESMRKEIEGYLRGVK